MKAVITPSLLKGTIAAPPSKSMAHRALISAALCEGRSRVENIAMSDDISATIACLRALGARIDVMGDTAEVIGIDPQSRTARCEMSANESGSTLRFLIPICLLSDCEAVITGAERLFQRPMGIYEEICKERGLRFERGKTTLAVQGKLTNGRYEIDGSVSSQFVSGLMFALPLLSGDSEIILKGTPESKPYILMTALALSYFGIKAEYDGDRRIVIPGKQKYIPADVTVEGDASNGAFFEAFNLIGGDVRVTGISPDTLQGDAVYRDYFARLSPENTLSLENCPDLAPVMFAMAAEIGGCTFTGTRRLRLKESDRGEAMAEELRKFGAELVIADNTVTVYGGKLHPPTEELCSHNDHRIAMAMSVLATKYGGTITDCMAVKKSMPDFYLRIAELGAKVKYEDQQ